MSSIIRSPKEVYDERAALVEAKMAAIAVKLEAHKEKARLNEKSWVHSGDMGHVLELLDGVSDFLNGG